jgi:hypothetical protein
MPASPQQNRYGDGETAGQTPLSEAAKGLAGQSGAASAGRLRQSPRSTGSNWPVQTTVSILLVDRVVPITLTPLGHLPTSAPKSPRARSRPVSVPATFAGPIRPSEPQRSPKSREFPSLCPLSPTGEF